MADVLTPEQRKKAMSNVRQKNTKPEKIVCSFLHKQGYRFRKNVSSLPSKPDIVLPKYKTVIFVHGCFWHQHKGCRRANRPTSNIEFWNSKLDKNIKRDKENIKLLKKSGWQLIVVWECELINTERRKKLKKKLIKKLSVAED